MSSDICQCKTMEVWTHHYGVFRLLSFCIGQRLPTLVFCVATHVMRKYIRNAQSCCERLASADVDRCTAMKSECTIRLHLKWRNIYGASRLPSFCIGRRLLTVVFCVTTLVTCTDIRNAQSCCERLASADVDRCTVTKSEYTINGAFRLHRSASVDV